MSNSKEGVTPNRDGLSYNRRSLLTGHHEGQATPDELKKAEELQRAFVDPSTTTITGEGQNRAALVVARREGFAEGFERAIASLPDLSRLATLPETVRQLEELLARANVTALSPSTKVQEAKPIIPVPNVSVSPAATSKKVTREEAVGGTIGGLALAVIVVLGVLDYSKKADESNRNWEEKNQITVIAGEPSRLGWVLTHPPHGVFVLDSGEGGLVRHYEDDVLRLSNLKTTDPSVITDIHIKSHPYQDARVSTLRFDYLSRQGKNVGLIRAATDNPAYDRNLYRLTNVDTGTFHDMRVVTQMYEDKPLWRVFEYIDIYFGKVVPAEGL